MGTWVMINAGWYQSLIRKFLKRSNTLRFCG